MRCSRRSAGKVVASISAWAGLNFTRGWRPMVRLTAWLISRCTISRARMAAMTRKTIRSGVKTTSSARLWGNQSGMGPTSGVSGGR